MPKRKQDKPKPPPVSTLARIEQRDLHNSLSLALIRAQAVLMLSESLVDGAEHDGKVNSLAISRVDPIPSLRGLQSAWLWFASAEVIMEFWGRRGFSDAAIDAMLADSGKRTILKAFRNAVFHPAPINDERISRFYDEWENISAWVSQVLQLMTEYTRAWYAQYISEIPHAGRVD